MKNQKRSKPVIFGLQYPVGYRDQLKEFEFLKQVKGWCLFYLSFCWKCNKLQVRDEGIVVLGLISVWKVLFNSFKLQSCQLINRLSGTQEVLMNFIFHFKMCNILLFIKPPEGGTVRFKEEPLLFSQASSISHLLDFLFSLKLMSLLWQWCAACHACGKFMGRDSAKSAACSLSVGVREGPAPHFCSFCFPTALLFSLWSYREWGKMGGALGQILNHSLTFIFFCFTFRVINLETHWSVVLMD